MAPRHSVILSSYNRPRLVQAAIDSVLGQTVQDFEVLVADDGSDAQTLEVLRRAAAADKRISLLTIEGRQVPEHQHIVNRSIDRINEALGAVTGDIIHYLCDDDLFSAERFAVFDELFGDPRAMVGYGRLNYIDAAGQPLEETRYFPCIKDPFCKLDHNQFAHRRATLTLVPEWEYPDPLHYFGDGQYMRALSKLWPFVGLDRIVAYKRRHGFNMVDLRDASRGKRE